MRELCIRRLWQLDPEYGHAPWRASPTEPERVLHIHLGNPEEPQTSLCQALASLAGRDGYRRVEWTTLNTLQQRHHAILDAAASLRPSLVFMQLQRPDVLTPFTGAELRRASSRQDLVVVVWCGDVGGVNGPFPAPHDRWAFDLSAHCDLMLYTSLSQVRAYRSRGMHNAAYLQIGFDEDRYFEGPDDGYGSNFDVAFLGRKYHDHQWVTLPGHESSLRQEVVESMQERLGQRFGLFGQGWGVGAAHMPAGQSGEVYRRSYLALSVSICSFLERYSSDRLFRALACGPGVLLKSFDDWRSLGLAHGENVLIWDTINDAWELVKEWLDPARRECLREVGRKGAHLARQHHSWGIRMQELLPMVMVARGALPEVNRPW